MGKRVFITDKEVAAVAEISTTTLSRIMSGFHRGRHADGEKKYDIASAEHGLVGGYRRWNAASVASVLGITAEELERRIS